VVSQNVGVLSADHDACAKSFPVRLFGQSNICCFIRTGPAPVAERRSSQFSCWVSDGELARMFDRKEERNMTILVRPWAERKWQ